MERPRFLPCWGASLGGGLASSAPSSPFLADQPAPQGPFGNGHRERRFLSCGPSSSGSLDGGCARSPWAEFRRERFVEAWGQPSGLGRSLLTALGPFPQAEWDSAHQHPQSRGHTMPGSAWLRSLSPGAFITNQLPNFPAFQSFHNGVGGPLLSSPHYPHPSLRLSHASPLQAPTIYTARTLSSPSTAPQTHYPRAPSLTPAHTRLLLEFSHLAVQSMAFQT